MMNAIDELVTNTFTEYWGFDKFPFPKIAAPGETFYDKRMHAAIDRLSHLLSTMEIGVVLGEAGTGKSTLLEMFLNRVSSTRYRVLHLSVPPAKPRELYRSIASAMGVNTSWFGADALKVTDLLSYSYLESNRPNLLLIDEAHILSPQCLNELRLLTNTVVKHEPIITLMLFGQPALASTLKLPALLPLAQRIGAFVSLGGFSEEETAGYVRWQIEHVGSEKEVFPQATLKAIHRRSQGIPRMINRLALESLHQACLEGAKTITEDLFALVCKNLGPHLN